MTIVLSKPAPMTIELRGVAGVCVCGWTLSGPSEYAEHVEQVELGARVPCGDPRPRECDHPHGRAGVGLAQPEGCPEGEVDYCCGDCH